MSLGFNAFFAYVLMLFKDELSETPLETEQSSTHDRTIKWRVIGGKDFGGAKSLYLPVTSQDLDSIGLDTEEMNYESSRAEGSYRDA